MFQTARFKIHNPSRHKVAMLTYALKQYHLTLKKVLERTLAIEDLESRIIKLNKRDKKVTDKAALSRIVYGLAPKDWGLAPLRDYLIGDAIAMILSFYEKALKGDEEAKPPTMSSLTPMLPEEKDLAFSEFASTVDFVLRPDQDKALSEAREQGQVHRARKLLNIFSSQAERVSYRDLLRKLEGPLPRPLEFTRSEFARGFVLARKGDNFYLMVRLFSKGHRYWNRVVLDEGFINWRTKEDIGGQAYPGLVLPLEFGRDYHEQDYLGCGEPKSAKLLIKRSDDLREEFYVHIAFEFKSEAIQTETFFGLDRGSAIIGAGTVINAEADVLAQSLNLVGDSFNHEQALFRKRIAEAQSKNKKAPRLFRLRRRRANIIIGEYANKIIAEAVRLRSQIVVEDINARAMNRFLNNSQFQKLRFMLDYKAERAGLPKPIDVPAAFTSQTCAKCGHKDAANRPKLDSQGKAIQAVFLCVKCGYAANADDNASEVIALRGLHQKINGGRYQKFSAFQEWLVGIRSREVGLAQPAGG